MRFPGLPCLSAIFLTLLSPSDVAAYSWNDFEEAPHNYNTAELKDPMSLLLKRIEVGELTIEEAPGKDLVARLLEELDIPVSSQTLVFTQTSLQRKIVNPGNPRAMYFNEDVYLGWMPGGRIEIASVDPDLGMIFYFQRELDRTEGDLFRRERRCLGCHAGSATNFLPGLLGRSVFPDQNGRSMRSVNSFFRIGHDAEFADRWGGWFVTGQQHGSLRHMANAIATRNSGAVTLDRDAGNRITSDLSRFFPESLHLSPGSDVLAMLAHDHQISAHYYINQAQYKVRQALHDNQRDLNSDRSVIAELTPSSRRLAADGMRELLRYFTFADEAPFGGQQVQGDEAYRKDFQANRRESGSGRSLKDLDMKDRLLKFRVSWMIYSRAFDGMPPAARQDFYHQLYHILTAPTPPEGFEHLQADEKQTLYEILSDTKPELAKAWASLADTKTSQKNGPDNSNLAEVLGENPTVNGK